MADDSKIQVVIELDDGSVKQGFIRMEKQAEETTGKISQFFQRAGAVAAGIFIEKVVVAGLNSIKQAIAGSLDEAIKAESAINQLNTSLRLAGSFSAEASQSFQKMASEIQRTTQFSDEQALSAASLARNFARTNEEAEKLTRAAADLAVATGVDLNTAVTKLGGTLSGSIGLLGKQVPALKSLSASSLEAGAAIDVVAQRFQGAAQLGAQTFAGSITKLGNAFSDVQEEIGKFVTKSPAIQAVIVLITDKLVKFASSLSGIRENGGDVFKPIIQGFADFSQAVIQFGIAPIELFFNITKTVFNGIQVLIQSFISSIALVASKIASFFAPESDLARSLNTFAESSQETLVQFADNTKESFSKLNDFSFSAGLSNAVTEINNAAQSAQEPLTSLDVGLAKVSTGLFTVGNGFSVFADGVKNQAADLRKNVAANFESIGRTAFNTIGQGVGGAFAAMGKAIVQGKNALTAFTNAIISAFGQVATQLGTQFILTGIAYTYAGYPNGPALIGAGAALAAFGGILSAIGGGGGAAGTPAATAGTDSSGFAPQTPSIDESGSVSNKANQRVVVNIQGDVLDSRETSLRIIELINDGIAEQGAQITARAN